MNFKSLVIGVAALLLVLGVLGEIYRRSDRRPVAVAPPTAAAPTAQQIKAKVALLNGNLELGPYGVNIKAAAADELAGLGQAAKDAGAIAELTRLSQSGKVQPAAREAAKAALAKLNTAPDSP
jgi:hypothetical protein